MTNERSDAGAVKLALGGRTTKTGGTLSIRGLESGFVTFEPSRRQRLDHFGNGGEGWDEEGWEDRYAGPLRTEVKALLVSTGIVGWRVTIGEKGHVDLTPSD